MDHIAYRYAHCPACAALPFYHLGTAVLRPLRDRVLESWTAIRQTCEEQSVHGGRGPNRHHRIPMLAKHQSFDLRRCEIEFQGDQRTESGSVQHRAQSVYLVPGQAHSLNGELGENI